MTITKYKDRVVVNNQTQSHAKRKWNILHVLFAGLIICTLLISTVSAVVANQKVDKVREQFHTQQELLMLYSDGFEGFKDNLDKHTTTLEEIKQDLEVLQKKIDTIIQKK